MGKIKLLLVLVSLFIGFSVYAGDEGKGQPKVYIVYRDTNGKMAKTIYDPALLNPLN